MRFRGTALLLGTALTACGTTAPPPPPPTSSVTVSLFYDENGNGTLDGGEMVHIPNARVNGGSATGTTDANGQGTLFALQGSDTFTADPTTLPPFFEVRPVTATVPASGDVRLAATLPIGANNPNVYMAFGDSITQYYSYPETLVDQLKAYFGSAYCNNEGISGTRTSGKNAEDGVNRINDTLIELRPAYTLILYGTNDWNDTRCRGQATDPCFTIPSLKYIVDGAKGAQSLPFLATIPPVNVGYPNGEAPQDRQDWVSQIDDQIRTLAQQDGAVLVDVQKAFLAEPDQSSLFIDHIHPSPKGVDILVKTFFKAITERQASS